MGDSKKWLDEQDEIREKTVESARQRVLAGGGGGNVNANTNAAKSDFDRSYSYPVPNETNDVHAAQITDDADEMRRARFNEIIGLCSTLCEHEADLWRGMSLRLCSAANGRITTPQIQAEAKRDACHALAGRIRDLMLPIPAQRQNR
jgi:hypothetical protein